MVWLASAPHSAYIMQLAVCVCVSHHLVDVTAGLQHLLLRLEQPTQLRSQVRCELLHSGDTNMLHQAPQVSVSPLQVAHQKTELGRLQRQQRSAGRAQEHSEEVRHPERQLDRFVMIGAI